MLQAALQEVEPQFKALHGATQALKQAQKLAGDEQAEALLMQKALARLQQAVLAVETPEMAEAVAAFEMMTQQALDGLALDFARDLRTAFERRGVALGGRPPALVVDPFVLHLDMAARKAQWSYGKEALTRPLPLSIGAILKAYDQQRKAIAERDTDVGLFLAELYQTWQELIALRARRPMGNRLNIVETYSKLVMNRQSARFWNAPSRSTFKDYARALFVRDLVSAGEAPTVTVEGRRYRLRLGVATKSQAENASRSIWLPRGALDGEYTADVTFEEVG